MSSARRRRLIVLFSCLTIVACKADGERAATAAAQAWLQATDAGNYAQAWTGAAPYLQRAVTGAEWDASMDRMRKPLGTVLSRTMKSSKTTTCALNDPCIVIETNASFQNKLTATETITVMPVQDRQWKVAGYYIK
jgi:uncharacterized protein DUF4019